MALLSLARPRTGPAPGPLIPENKQALDRRSQLCQLSLLCNLCSATSIREAYRPKFMLLCTLRSQCRVAASGSRLTGSLASTSTLTLVASVPTAHLFSPRCSFSTSHSTEYAQPLFKLTTFNPVNRKKHRRRMKIFTDEEEEDITLDAQRRGGFAIHVSEADDQDYRETNLDCPETREDHPEADQAFQDTYQALVDNPYILDPSLMPRRKKKKKKRKSKSAEESTAWQVPETRTKEPERQVRRPILRPTWGSESPTPWGKLSTLDRRPSFDGPPVYDEPPHANTTPSIDRPRSFDRPSAVNRSPIFDRPPTIDEREFWEEERTTHRPPASERPSRFDKSPAKNYSSAYVDYVDEHEFWEEERTQRPPAPARPPARNYTSSPVGYVDEHEHEFREEKRTTYRPLVPERPPRYEAQPAKNYPSSPVGMENLTRLPFKSDSVYNQNIRSSTIPVGRSSQISQPPPSAPPPSSTLVASNLPPVTREADLRRLFSRYGYITDVIMGKLLFSPIIPIS